ncbi:hypothetical protein [Nocardia sp. NPDC056100]|uniref:hypothetical protein n=1 Tax=Nocardia sp. NPDC056100 TaxID=3345712 RepID=UPI0035DF17C6
MAAEIDKSKVEKVVQDTRGDYEQGGCERIGFNDGEVENSLNRLLTLNAEEFKDAWGGLDDQDEHLPSFLPLKAELAKRAHERHLDGGKYKELVASLETNNVDTYYQYKVDKPVFSNDPAEKLTDQVSTHAATIQLIAPDGANAGFRALISDTEFVMQKDLDSLGLHRPKEEHPTFAPILLSDQKSTVLDGSSDIKDEHGALANQLKEREKQYNTEHQIATDATFDTTVTKNELFQKLVKMANEDLQEVLKNKLDGWRVDGDKLTKTTYYQHDHEPIVETYFERSAKDNIFYLNPSVERRIYIDPFIAKVKEWRDLYDKACKDILKDSEKVPAAPEKPKPAAPKATPETPASPSGTPAPPPSGTPAPPPSGTPTPPSGQNTDYSALFKDALANSPDGKATTTPPPSADGSTPPGTQPGTTPTDNNNQQVLDEIDAAENRIRQNDSVTPAVYNPGTNAGGFSSGGNAGGNSGGGGSSFDPSQLMMMSALQQAMQNRDNGKGGMQDDRGEPRRPRDPNTVTPAANTPGAPTVPGAPGAPGQPVVTADQTTPPPTNAKGLVNVTIPGLNGTQQVSPVVQDALTKAFSNPSGCDARAAYEGGPGQSTPGMPWKQITDAELRTGDIAQWGNRTAVVVMTDNGPQIIIDGKLGPMQDGHLVQFNPNMLPDSLGGEFGKFEGFFHPSGADLSTDGQAPPETKPADPPKVSVGAAPGVVPAATPRTGPSGEI